jgi:hypothetical protein
MRNAHTILAGKSKGKITVERPKCRWEESRTNLKETEWPCNEFI